MHAEVMIFGIGSPHGDDRAGWLVVEELQRRGVEPAVILGDVSDLLHRLPTCRRAVIIDACRSEPPQPPGQITIARWPSPAFATHRSTSTHGVDVAQALRLADQLGSLPAEVTLVGIEIADTSPGKEMCAAVAAATREAANLVERDCLIEMSP